MARATTIVSPKGLRKPVSFALVRAFPEADPATGAAASASAMPRVRDSLVLRLVGKKKSAAARSQTDERPAR